MQQAPFMNRVEASKKKLRCPSIPKTPPARETVSGAVELLAVQQAFCSPANFICSFPGTGVEDILGEIGLTE